MRRLSLLIIALIGILTLFSCDKDKDKDNIPITPENKDFYYIKYQISGKLYFYIDGISYTTEKGSESEKFHAVSSFERTCGPVKRGFVATIQITDKRGEPASNAVTISVSKNNGPFATKASGKESATYTIDF